MNPDLSHDVTNFITAAPCSAVFTAIVLITTIGCVLRALITGDITKALIFGLLTAGECALLMWADIGYLTVWLLSNDYYPAGYIVFLLFAEVSIIELFQVRRRIPPA
jgi:hypothetical protein